MPLLASPSLLCPSVSLGPLVVSLYSPPGPSLSSPTPSAILLVQMSTRSHALDASKNATNLRKEQLMALPSVSCSLSSLPQARSLDHVCLHPSSMSAQHAADSEAKLRKVLSKSASSHAGPSFVVTPPPNPPASPSPQLTMKLKSK